MKGTTFPWFIAGGWAVDLFLNRVTREHKDVEIGIFRKDQLILQSHLKEWELKKINKSSTEKPGELETWRDGEYLRPPTHEIHACTRNASFNLSELEILLNECDSTHWIFRRNHLIKHKLSSTILYNREGIPYLAPEIVFLYKAKAPKIYDEEDFNNTVNLLDPEFRTWLASSIELSSPDHPWLDRLA
ncbi:hypothetical protein JXM67_12445 [candidate division WOR-3 bacterium]|nr:hypothetical protein [candidate division WOR-3 bacterium]